MESENEITHSENRDTELTEPISERRVTANRRNAQKSTGPNTVEGKNRSRFNAVKHGLLSREFIPANGTIGPAESQLEILVEDLRDKYGRDDVHVEFLLEQLIVDYRRNAYALAHEKAYVSSGMTAFHVQGSISTFERYINSNRRSMLRIMNALQTLKQTK